MTFAEYVRQILGPRPGGGEGLATYREAAGDLRPQFRAIQSLVQANNPPAPAPQQPPPKPYAVPRGGGPRWGRNIRPERSTHALRRLSFTDIFPNFDLGEIQNAWGRGGGMVTPWSQNLGSPMRGQRLDRTGGYLRNNSGFDRPLTQGGGPRGSIAPRITVASKLRNAR